MAVNRRLLKERLNLDPDYCGRRSSVGKITLNFSRKILSNAFKRRVRGNR